MHPYLILVPTVRVKTCEDIQLMIHHFKGLIELCVNVKTVVCMYIVMVLICRWYQGVRGGWWWRWLLCDSNPWLFQHGPASRQDSYNICRCEEICSVILPRCVTSTESCFFFLLLFYWITLSRIISPVCDHSQHLNSNPSASDCICVTAVNIFHSDFCTMFITWSQVSSQHKIHNYYTFLQCSLTFHYISCET